MIWMLWALLIVLGYIILAAVWVHHDQIPWWFWRRKRPRSVPTGQDGEK